MNKTWKSLVALAAGGALAMSGMVGVSSAFAVNQSGGTDAEYTIQKGAADTHTYTVFQLLKGDVDATGKVSNAVAGSNLKFPVTIDSTAYATPRALAEALNGKTGTTALATQLGNAVTGDGSALGSGFVSGYYLVKDTTDPLGEGESHNRYVLVTVGANADPITVQLKRDTVTIEKKVNEQDSASYNIGDKVPFTLTGSLPENYGDYTYYKYKFTDTMSKGLTYNNDAKVTIDTANGTDITDSFDIAWNHVGSGDPTGDTILTVQAKAGDANEYLKSVDGLTADNKIVVSYTATLNPGAVVGQGDATNQGNLNKAYLEFTSHPSEDKMGKTIEDKTTVFTFGLDVNKTFAGANAPTTDLPEFTLYTVDASGNVSADPYMNSTYNNNPNAVKGEGGNPTGAVKVAKDGDEYKLGISGLAAGTYVLKETKTPAGFNTAADLKIVVTPTYDTTDATKITNLDVAVTQDDSTVEGWTAEATTGLVSGAIVNKPGSVLPSTGGMGTVLLYTVGGLVVLIAAAGLTIALKRRQS